jgi:hypothetical protein
MASWCGLVSALRSYSIGVTKEHIGTSQLDAMREMLDSTIQFRNENPDLSHYFIDIRYVPFFLFFFILYFVLIISRRYSNLVSEPMQCVKQLYEKLNMPLPEHLSDKFKHYLASQHKNKSSIQFTLEEFGLSKNIVDATFAPYIKQFNL